MRSLETLVDRDGVAGLRGEALRGIEREEGVRIVPLERARRGGAGLRVHDAEAGRGRRVHRLVERHVDLLPRTRVDPVRVGLYRVDGRRDRRERRGPVLLQHPVRG